MESANFCKRNGWTMATFQSDTEIDVAKDKVECNVYVGAISDGKGNWEWIDSSPWWAYGNNDGLMEQSRLKLFGEHRIVNGTTGE